jgi:hypothetical protein
MRVTSQIAFADVLDAKVGALPHIPSSQCESRGRPMTPPLLHFSGAPFRFAWTPYASMAPRPAKRACRSTPLTATEQRALGVLNDLGADLDEAMSLAELRHAFRSLARQHHPDRHPDSTDDEKVRLARLFATVTDHYRLLTASLSRQ